MTSCCTTPGNSAPPRAICPRNGKSYAAVSLRTVLHQLRKPWQWQLPQQGYYFWDSGVIV